MPAPPRAGPAASHFLDRDVLSVLQHGDYDEGFALALACKDLGLAVDLARAAGVPVPVSAAVEQIYRQARARYGDAGGEMLPGQAARRPDRHAAAAGRPARGAGAAYPSGMTVLDIPPGLGAPDTLSRSPAPQE